MRAILCGSRDWSDPAPILRAIQRLAGLADRPEVIHGGARGADAIAAGIAAGLGLSVRAELADWVGRGKAAGPERNQRMLQLRPDLVIAFKDGFNYALSRGGTENMVKIAKAAGVPCYLFSHDGGWRRIP